MKCKKYKEQIILYLYGELDQQHSQELEEHIENCPGCAGELEYTKKVFGTLDEAESKELLEARWEKCWGEINAEIKPKSRKQRYGFSPSLWIPAAAAVLVIFVLGIFIGRFWHPSPSAVLVTESPTPAFSQISLQKHFNSLKPLLLKYAGYSDTEEMDLPVDRKIIQNLLIQNFQLMRMIAQDDPGAVELLEDIELLLREITNMESGDTLKLDMIKDLMDQREILYHIEIFQTI